MTVGGVAAVGMTVGGVAAVGMTVGGVAAVGMTAFCCVLERGAEVASL
jgi:hypothetical protein